MSRTNTTAATRRLFDPAFLLGAVAVLSVWLVVEISRDQSVGAQTASTAGNLVVATGQVQGRGNADALYIYDGSKQKLVCYQASGNRFDVLAIRDCSHDWKFNQYPKNHVPSVKDMREGKGKDEG